jgi:hypothetical protein
LFDGERDNEFSSGLSKGLAGLDFVALNSLLEVMAKVSHWEQENA